MGFFKALNVMSEQYMKRLFFHKLFLFLAFVILAGCSNFEIYPFVSFHQSEKRTEFALRPIFQITIDKEKTLISLIKRMSGFSLRGLKLSSRNR